MRTATPNPTIRLLGLMCLMTLTCSVLVNAQQLRRVRPATTEIGPNTPATTEVGEITPATEIGVIVPDGNDFSVKLNHEKLSKLYFQMPQNESNLHRVQPASGNQELSVSVEREALRKVRTLFPTGVPAGAAKIKITVKVKLSKPPEVGVSVEW